MAAHDELMELQMKDVDSEDGDDEEELGDGKWDDWKEDEGADGESECNPLLLCLFCDSLYGSARSLFQHCASMHSFDYYGIKSACNLDFYGCLKLINYVRAQVASHKCWSCGNEYMSDKALQEHLHGSPELDRGSFPWSDDKYLKPFLHDDALLYSFSEDDDDDDEDEEDKKTMSIDEKEMKLYLSKFERIEMDHEDADTDIVCDNGGKDALLHADTDELDSKGSERLPANGVNYLLGGKLSGGALRNGRHGICSARLTNEINSINKGYFASYSSFGIHRDMISDKARTDAYRQAISENPSLMRRAVVMDVGCGTGILSLFAAQAGASMVIAVEASAKMAAVATQKTSV
ncbi:hypothetical protein M569_13710 [Genlisea aurea]|uniref:type I protein arginine methyltransferase n=1 Tax=Genlisea aurea TaxID=192259 RepID=S8C9P9_9LAMI|nr:hypothetical protein M569_13710 [Genlisea aurea]